MSKKQDIKDLQRRVEELEDRFSFPYENLSDSGFDEWIQHRALMATHKSTGWVGSELKLLFDYLGLEIVTYSERKVVQKATEPKSSTKRRANTKDKTGASQ